MGHNVNYYCCLYRPDGTKIIYGKTPNSNVDGDYIRYHIANDYTVSVYALQAGKYQLFNVTAVDGYYTEVEIPSSATFPYLLTSNNAAYTILCF